MEDLVASSYRTSTGPVVMIDSWNAVGSGSAARACKGTGRKSERHQPAMTPTSRTTAVEIRE